MALNSPSPAIGMGVAVNGITTDQRDVTRPATPSIGAYEFNMAAAATAPTVTSPTYIDVTATTATLGGDATSDGGATITTRGVLYAPTATDANPTLGDGMATEVDDMSGGAGVFTEGVTGLSPNTAYSFVAFAANSVGTTYTSPVSTFTTKATGYYYEVTSLADGAGTITGGDGLSSATAFQATTLLAAVNDANINNPGADVIMFDPSLFTSGAATLNLSTAGDSTFGLSDLGVTTDVTIEGPTGSNGLTLNNSVSGQRLFYISSAGSLTLDNLTITGGDAVGGNGGDAEFGGGGGGAGLGGAVYDDGGAFTALGCTFTNNTAVGGNGGNGDNGVASDYGGAGGGVNGGAANGAPGNPGGFGGGGGGAEDRTGGAGGFGGGGGGASSGSPGGAGGFGGGHGALALRGAGGGGAGLGGGIFSNGGTLTLTNDTFFNNQAVGGGFGTGASGQATAGSGYGGAVFALNGSLTATFVTFSGNTAAQDGTDVYVLSDSTDSGVNNGAAAANAALVNDILGQTANSVSDFTANSVAGGTTPTLTSSSNDVVSNNTPSSGGVGLPGAAVVHSDPNLSALTDNGGPTETMALNSPSPAIGMGVAVNGITTDQRGVTRVGDSQHRRL